MRPTLAGLALLAATLLVTACGESTIDASKGERFIRGVVADQVAARVRSVRCPTDIETQKGDTFTCAVTGVDGTRGTVNVTQKDDDGNVSVSAPFLHVREAETVMAGQLGKRFKLEKVTVACPEIVVVKKDGRFNCEATAQGRPRNVAVRLTDDEGHFAYRLSATGADR